MHRVIHVMEWYTWNTARGICGNRAGTVNLGLRRRGRKKGRGRGRKRAEEEAETIWDAV